MGYFDPWHQRRYYDSPLKYTLALRYQLRKPAFWANTKSFGLERDRVQHITLHICFILVEHRSPKLCPCWRSHSSPSAAVTPRCLYAEKGQRGYHCSCLAHRVPISLLPCLDKCRIIREAFAVTRKVCAKPLRVWVCDVKLWLPRARANSICSCRMGCCITRLKSHCVIARLHSHIVKVLSKVHTSAD